MKDYLKAFDKIIGYGDEKRKLMPICDMMRNPEKYKKLGVVIPSGAILQGPPGYGKTLMCKCFIEACGVPYFVCRKDKADGDFVNYIKKCFDDAAEQAPAIVFLDDMDKFANEDQDHKNAEEYVAVQACIDNVKGKNVFVIATTNDMYNLPDSLLRAGRFDINLEMCGLEQDDQIKLIEHFLSNKPFVESVSSKDIWNIIGGCTSCAELEKIINDAAMEAAFKGQETLTREDFIVGCLNFHFGGAPSSRVRSKEELLSCAYHEAGHAVVAEVLMPKSIGLISIKPYRATGSDGVTTYDRIFEGEDSYDKSIIIATASLGGKAATEIVFNKLDLGTKIDIRHARRVLEELRDNNAAFGFDKQEYYGCGQTITEEGNRIISNELDRLYSVAKKVLIENRAFLDAIANALLEKETLLAEDIQAIKKELKLE